MVVTLSVWWGVKSASQMSFIQNPVQITIQYIEIYGLGLKRKKDT